MSKKLCGFVITVEEALWLIYSDINTPVLIEHVEEALELDFMEAELNRIRTGQIEIQIPMSEATLDAIEEEWIGQEQSTSGGHFQ